MGHEGSQAYSATGALLVIEEGPCHSKKIFCFSEQIDRKHLHSLVLLPPSYIRDSFVIVIQVTQQVYVVEEWVRNANSRFDAESQSRRDVEKALGAIKEEKMQLVKKLKVSKHERNSALARLKNAEAQARKLLYTIEVNMATKKATVLSLKAELQKAKVAIEVARVAAKAAEEAAYECGMEDAEKRLAEEVAEVCKDYCSETWVVALNRVGVPTDSELRKAESVFFPEVIREAPTDLPPTVTLSLPPPKQVSDTKVLVRGAEIPMGVVGKGKEVLSLAKDVPAKDSLTIKDMVS